VVANTDNGIESTKYSPAWTALTRLPGSDRELNKLNSHENTAQCAAAFTGGGIYCATFVSEVYLRKVNASLTSRSSGRVIQSFFEVHVGGALEEEDLSGGGGDTPGGLGDPSLSEEGVSDMVNQFYDFLGSAAEAFGSSSAPELDEGTFQESLGYRFV
jgi:hypothetical protein